MPTSGTQVRAARAAFEALIDYAGLFPPAQLPMPEAIDSYATALSGPYRWMLGKFIVPASRIANLLDALGSQRFEQPPALSIIVEAPRDPRAWLDNVRAVLSRLAGLRAAEQSVSIEALEVVLPERSSERETYDAPIGQFAAAAQQTGMRDVPAFVEMPRDRAWSELLPGTAFALARHRLNAKLRCGGVVPEAFPTSVEVAGFIAAMAAENVPFKATAGLHHPLRRLDAVSGFRMHGFLNLLVAAAQARVGAGAAEMQTFLDREDPSIVFGEDGLRFGDAQISAQLLEETRRAALLSYGSCSFDEPVDDVTTLGAVRR